MKSREVISRQQLHVLSCDGKVKFPTKAEAKRKDRRVYKCHACGFFHRSSKRNSFVTSDANRTTGVILRGLRLSKGLSQSELAKLIGLRSKATIQSIEQGRHYLNPYIARRLREVFGNEYHEFLDPQA